MPENRFKHLGNIIVTRPVLLRLRALLRSLKEGLAPVCLDRWALGEVPAEIDSLLMPRVHSGKRFGVACVHGQHLHDCLTFIPTPSMRCVALLTKFQLKCHEMFAYQAMRYGNEKICKSFAFVSYVIWISRLSLSLEGDLEQIETTCGDARGMGVYMVLSL